MDTKEAEVAETQAPSTETQDTNAPNTVTTTEAASFLPSQFVAGGSLSSQDHAGERLGRFPGDHPEQHDDAENLQTQYWPAPYLGQDVVYVEGDVGHAAKVTAINSVKPWESSVNLVIFFDQSIPKSRANVAFYPAAEARQYHVSAPDKNPVPPVHYCYDNRN